ncbi:MAG: hypothetical protein ACRCYY_13200 [Trueperaceae bacterium]
MKQHVLPIHLKLRFVSFVAFSILLNIVLAQDSYLSDQGSKAESTNGASRLLHYLPEDIPIKVYIPEPKASALENNNSLESPTSERDSSLENTTQSFGTSNARDTVIRAFEAWEDAVPGLITFEISEFPLEDALALTWQTLEPGKIGSYLYTYSITEDGQYRFRATDIFLDPGLDEDTLYRYALVQVGHALGLLGRSPYEGDALSQSPSGIITERDKATLQALYAVPSGTPLF